ncbi:MAG TPA: hypothetical protein VFY23_14435 [Candidatus Limnocylindrales bacterium]|nr:hypothetical protein [Candidatus Limnocylindrales bacterium]
MSRPASVARIAAVAAAVAVIVPSAAIARTAVTGFETITRTFDVQGAAAEIAAVTPDGRTLLYTSAGDGTLGFVDISNPSAPVEAAPLALSGEPTSVGVTKDGAYALVVVDTSAGDFVDPSGYLAAVDLADRTVERTWQLGGQPDAIAVSPSGKYAAIVIENQRDEDLDPDGDGPIPLGGMPQEPAGRLAIVDLADDPDEWGLRTTPLAGLPGLRFPADPEPEYVDIAPNDTAAVTLQENNAVVLVNLKTGLVVTSWSAGSTTHAADLTDDGGISFTESLTARREPDAIAWTPAGSLVTANEGDYPDEDGQLPAGSRDFAVFDALGTVIFEPGVGFEQALGSSYADGRSDNRGSEPEGVEVGQYTGATFLFVGAERANAVVVYRIRGTEPPQYVQTLRTGTRPEGLLAIPQRNLFVTANEAGGGTISIFRAVSGS